MSELIVVALAFVFGVMPLIGAEMIGTSQTYKSSFLLGNGILIFLALLCIALTVITLSVQYLLFDGISLYEATIKIVDLF